MRPIIPNTKNDLRKIQEELNKVSKDISEIKELMLKLWILEDKENNKRDMYPWNLSNANTSADGYDEEG